MITLLLLVRATCIWVLFFAHIPFVVNRTFNATPAERLQQGASPFLVMGLGQSRDREVPDALGASAQFTPLHAEAGCETC